MEELAGRLARIPGVVAVTLGGSRAIGAHTPESDWDFGLYYRGEIGVDAIRGLGYDGEVAEPGEWGRLVNGGAWLTVEGKRVDLLYRDLETVEHWSEEARAGRFEVDNVEGYVAGMATYVLPGELALGRILHGRLPRPEFPQALREPAGRYWRRSAEFSAHVAQAAARRGDAVSCVGLLARAALAAAQARLAERGEWALNEKGIVRRAGLGAAEGIVASAGLRPDDLSRAVQRMRVALELQDEGSRG
jgi:predicted nucleotidyltransferase